VRDQGREPVIVAETDLVGGHGVVLVDDRHRVQGPQPVQGALGVGVLDTLGDVMGGQQHLPHGAVIAREGGAPGIHQGHLADAGRGLFGGQVGGATAQAQRLDTGRDRSG
jgi:hypothetical protein